MPKLEKSPPQKVEFLLLLRYQFDRSLWNFLIMSCCRAFGHEAKQATIRRRSCPDFSLEAALSCHNFHFYANKLYNYSLAIYYRLCSF